MMLENILNVTINRTDANLQLSYSKVQNKNEN